MVDFILEIVTPFLTRTMFIAVTTLAGTGIAIYFKEPIVRKWETFKARKWLQRVPASGVSNFFPNRDSYHKYRDITFLEYIASANHTLSYCGHWLAFTIDQHNTLDALCDLAKGKKHVQLTLLDPELSEEVLISYATYFNEDKDYLLNQIKNTWNKVETAKKNLDTQSQENFELRKHKEFISYSSFWFDKGHENQHILIDAKIFGISRRDSYGVELKPSKNLVSSNISLFDRYSKSIEVLIKKSKIG